MEQGYTMIRPGRGPSDDDIRDWLALQQEGEIAFQLGRLADVELLKLRGTVFENQTYNA